VGRPGPEGWAGTMNVSLLLEMVADGDGDRIVVGPAAGGLSARHLLIRSRRLAGLLRSKGVAQLGLIDVNSEAVPIGLFGAALAGVPFAPINYRLGDDQLDLLLRRLVPGLVVAGPDVLPRIKEIEGLEVISTRQMLEEVSDERWETELDYVDPDHVALMLFTSGTTGQPKAALLRHRHLTSYIMGTVEFLGADPSEAQLVSVPPYHIAGISAVLSSLYSGRRIVYLPGFEAEEWVRAVSDEGISQAMVVPTMLGRILNYAEESGRDLSSLHHLSYGGGRMPVEVIERAMRMLPHVDFVNAYGLTETSSTVAVLTPEDHRVAVTSPDPAVRRRLTSVGRPLPTLELEIRDADGRSVGPGERGEIRADRSSRPTVGFPPMTPVGSTRTGTCTSTAGSTMSLCGAPRTFPRVRSRRSSSATPPSPRRPWSAFPIPSGVRRWARRSCSRAEPTSRRRSCSNGCVTGCVRPGRHRSCSSVSRCPTTRRESFCVGCSARSWRAEGKRCSGPGEGA
jgi:fatty-acyl-CoA synthase